MSADAAAAPVVRVITTANVSKLTTFELRQELVRRGSMDLEESQISHNTLLQRLIQDLVRDEAAAATEHVAVAVSKAQEERDAAKALREERKREALERSKARQADPNYFKARAELNVKPSSASTSAEGGAGGAQGGGEGGGGDVQVLEEEEEEAEEEQPDDVFRIGGKKKNKIFVK